MIVTGPPATGKTTLAARVARELESPLIAKDAIKEALFDSFGSRDRAWSRDVGNAAFELLFRLVEQQLESTPVIVVEANFAAEQAEVKLRSLLDRADADVVQVYCADDDAAIVERFRERASSMQRHRGHADVAALPEVVAGLARGRWRPLELGGDVVRVQFPPTDDDVHTVATRVRDAIVPSG